MLAFARQGESNDQKFTLFSCFINSMASMSCVSQAVPFTSRTIFASHLSLSAPSPSPNFMCDNNTGLLLQISKILSNARNGHDGLFFFDHYCRTEQSSLHYEISLQCIFSFLHIDSTWCHIITITAKIVCTRKLDAAWKKQKQKHFDSFTLLFFVLFILIYQWNARKLQILIEKLKKNS